MAAITTSPNAVPAPDDGTVFTTGTKVKGASARSGPTGSRARGVQHRNCPNGPACVFNADVNAHSLGAVLLRPEPASGRVATCCCATAPSVSSAPIDTGNLGAARFAPAGALWRMGRSGHQGRR